MRDAVSLSHPPYCSTLSTFCATSCATSNTSPCHAYPSSSRELSGKGLRSFARPLQSPQSSPCLQRCNPQSRLPRRLYARGSQMGLLTLWHRPTRCWGRRHTSRRFSRSYSKSATDRVGLNISHPSANANESTGFWRGNVVYLGAKFWRGGWRGRENISHIECQW